MTNFGKFGLFSRVKIRNLSHYFYIYLLALILGVMIATFEESHRYNRLKYRVSEILDNLFGWKLKFEHPERQQPTKHCHTSFERDSAGSFTSQNSQNNSSFSKADSSSQTRDDIGYNKNQKSILTDLLDTEPTLNNNPDTIPSICNNDFNYHELEALLHNLANFIVRDYIQSWHQWFSPDDKLFLKDIRNIILLIFQKLFVKIEKINWHLFFTTKPLEVILNF